MSAFIKSPLNYTGGKHKLLPQIMPIIESGMRGDGRFIDLFCGGANVAANIRGHKVIANNINSNVIGIMSEFQKYSAEDIISHIRRNIEKYGLSLDNQDGYNRVRNDYNKGDKNPLDLFTIICYSFNHQIRFNGKGDYNMPFGKNRSQYNPTIEKNLINFCNAIKDVTFTCKSFADLDIDKMSENDFVYADPPYLITCASYNEKDGWNEDNERQLLDLLGRLNNRGIHFALSNVLMNKGSVNEILNSWIESNSQYKVHHLNYSYNNCSYHAKDRTKLTDEILVTNY